MSSRIYIDLTSYSPTYQGGVSTYVKGLVSGMRDVKHSVNIFLLTFDDVEVPLINNLDSGISAIRVKKTAPKTVNILHRINYRVFRSRILLTAIQFLSNKNIINFLVKNPGVVYCPTTYANFPTFNSKLLVSMHDIQEKRYPEFFTKSQKIYRDLNVRNTLRLASHIQVSSQFVREEIVKYYPEDSASTIFEVIPEGVHLHEPSEQVKKFSKPRQKSLLLPASFHPHKNQTILLDVFQHLKCHIKVSLTGDVGIHERREDFLQLARKHDFHLLGFLSEEDLGEVYRESSIVLSTSLYESSSLPLLEGISSGCIPIASDIPAHREMALNLKIFLFDPSDPLDLAITLDKVAKLKEKEVRIIQQWNMEKLKQYSWKSVAQKYVELLSSI